MEPNTPREHPDVLEREDWNRATSLAIYWKGQAELAEQARYDAIAAVVSERVERRKLERELEELRGSATEPEAPTPR